MKREPARPEPDHLKTKRIFLSNRRRFTAAVLIGAWIIFNLLTLTIYPTPVFDDSFFASIAYQLMQHGNFGFPLYGDMMGTASSVFHVGRLFIIGLAVTFYILGMGLYQARLYSFLGGLVSAMAVFKLGKELWGTAEAWLGATILFLSPQMLWSSHTVRPDTWVNAVGLAGLCYFTAAQPYRRPWHSFWFGLVVFLLLDVHLKAVHYIATIATIMVLSCAAERRYRPHLFAFGAGGSIAVVYWLAVHFLPEPLLMYRQWTSGPFSTILQPKGDLIHRVNDFLQMAWNGTVNATRLGWLEIAYFITGIGILIWRRFPGDRRILVMLIAFTVSFILLMPEKSPIHLILFRPFLGLAVAASATTLADGITARILTIGRHRHSLTLALVLPLIGGYVIGDCLLAWRNRIISFTRYVDQLAAYIPEDANVLAEDTWWYGFHKGMFTSDFYLAANAPGDHDPSQQTSLQFVQRIVRERQVDFILIDERIASWYAEIPSSLETIHPYIREYAQTHCHFLGSVRDYFHGVDQNGPAIKQTQIFKCGYQ